MLYVSLARRADLRKPLKFEWLRYSYRPPKKNRHSVVKKYFTFENYRDKKQFFLEGIIYGRIYVGRFVG